MTMNVQTDYDLQMQDKSSELIGADAVNPDSMFLGIDIGGTNTKIGLVNRKGLVGEMISFPTLAEKSFRTFTENLVDRVKNGLLAGNPGSSISGIGVGAPNANHLTGEIENPSNLSWGTVNIAAQLSELFSAPVAVNNDANAAAMGEKYFGAAQAMENFVLLTLGTGLGGGIVVNGIVVTGEEGHAGEIGHIIVRPDGRQCGCGRRGCLETYVSAPGLRRTVFELLSEYTMPSDLRRFSFDQLRAEDITHAAMNGDQIALNAFEITGRILGQKLADLTALLNPEAIILAGGLVNAGDFLLNPVKRHLEANLLEVLQGTVKIISSHISGGSLAVLGASAYVMRKIASAEPDAENKRVVGNM